MIQSRLFLRPDRADIRDGSKSVPKTRLRSRLIAEIDCSDTHFCCFVEEVKKEKEKNKGGKKIIEDAALLIRVRPAGNFAVLSRAWHRQSAFAAGRKWISIPLGQERGVREGPMRP